MKNLILIAFLAFSAMCYAQDNKTPHKTVITEKRIIVTSGKISDEEFDTLINKTIAQYKDRPGIEIIIKAPRHKTFNYKTPDADQPEYIAFKIINSHEKSNNVDTDELQPVTIKFTKVLTNIQDSIQSKTGH